MEVVKRKTQGFRRKTINDSYVVFKNKNPNTLISREKYREMLVFLFKRISEEVLNGGVVHLPHNLGFLCINKFKSVKSKPPIDFKATKDLGYTVYHLNFESDGWCAKWNWSRFKYRITNMHYYSFVPTRGNKRALSVVMKRGEQNKFISR